MFSRDMIAQKEAYDEWVEDQARLAEVINREVIEMGVEEYYERKKSEESTDESKRVDV